MTASSLHSLRFPLLALGALLGACTSDGVYVSDDLDLEFQLAPGEPDDQLHLPYVQGASVNLRPGIVDDDGSTSTAGYRLESSDPAVLAPADELDPSSGEQTFVAVAPGTTTIRVLDPGGDSVHEAEITVRAPTRAELYPSGLQVVHTGRGRVALERAQVLEGGSATFLLQYYDGDQRLYGNGVLDATSDGEIGLAPATTYLFANREWLEITPSTLGVHTVALAADGVALGDFDVEVVPDSAVAEVELVGEVERDADDGDTLSVLAQAYDADGEPIYGVTSPWDVDGARQLGDGDVYQYTYAGAAPATLGATFGDVNARADIHLGSGTVGSSGNIGCSVTPGLLGTIAVALPAALAALALASRRRR